MLISCCSCFSRTKSSAYEIHRTSQMFPKPAELATAYVMPADPLSSYVYGAAIAVTGGKPIL